MMVLAIIQMNALYVVVMTLAVQIVLVYQMVTTWKITAAHVMLTTPMTVYRIVLVLAVIHM
ncbi:MAG TPA: hypothetical protein QF517_11280 [Pseudomonadales bacterium]|nr:hypothetical protein [Pseudomonadales bacterium]